MIASADVRAALKGCAWQDELLMAIMNADPVALDQVLEREGRTAIDAVLQRREVNGRPIFTLANRLYVQEHALREVLGGDFFFEDEVRLGLIASWLEMMGARAGDTMMHLVMRLNGAEVEDKSACAVQLLGRHAPWEVENVDGDLASMVDTAAFRQTFFRDLPAWREENQREAKRRAKERAAAATGEKAAKRQEALRKAQAELRKKHWDALRAKAKDEVKKEDERQTLHRRLNRALTRLEAREQRAAKSDPAYVELAEDLRALPRRLERWFIGITGRS